MSSLPPPPDGDPQAPPANEPPAALSAPPELSSTLTPTAIPAEPAPTDIPPLLQTPLPPPPVLLAVPPPLLPAESSPTPARLPRSLLLAVILVGVAQIALSLLVPAPIGSNIASTSYRIGTVIGGTAVWPLIFIGLFSIGRRFRTPRSRAIILLSVWGFAILGHLGNISARSRQQLRMRGPDSSARSSLPSGAFDYESSSSPSPKSAAEPPLPAPSTSVATQYDFSTGSDERLVKSIESAQEDRYHAIVAAYARECAARPYDAALALERVKFIDHFANAEDLTIESAEEDRKQALANLTGRFPIAPGTVLYLLDRAYGPDFETKADDYAPLVPRWPAAQRARFFLQRANAASGDGRSARMKSYARLSFEAEPTGEAGLLLANAAHDANDTAECLRILSHRVFDSVVPWQKKQKMDLLFDLKQSDRAVALYRTIKAEAPDLLNQSETAMRLARAGQVDEARAILGRMPVNEWNRARATRSRFDFELEFGDATHARDAYRALRDTGIRADPILRDRIALFWKHPRLGWNAQDLVGAILLALLVAAVALAPLLFLIPVHYWSLLRARRGKSTAWPGARWGLRGAWAAFGVLFCADVAAIWAFQPQVMRTWWNDRGVAERLQDKTLLSEQTLVWIALAAILTALLWRARAWRLLGGGQWRGWKTIGLGLAATLGLRIGLVVYTLIWPGAISGDFASFSPETRQLCFALLKNLGPFGLMATIGLLVPVLEELLFRGVLLQALARHIPFGWANAGQALAFAAVHENLRLLPFFFSFGVVGGILARRSDGLLASIVMHAGNNLLACLALILLNRTMA